METYDIIGKSYNMTRRADPRIVARLVDLLSLPSGSTIADIGAGTGNYSLELARAGFRCIAIEPSSEMTKQAATHESLEWILGSAESLPLPDESVSGCISVLSYHHLRDRRAAVNEMLRIAGDGPIIVFTFCPQRLSTFWLYRYFPSMLADARSSFRNVETTMEDMERWSGRAAILHWFPLPSDIGDWFAAAGWCRPELYLDTQVRQGISSFSKVPDLELKLGLQRLSSDLADGTWDLEFGQLRNRDELDLGYAFIRLAT